MDQKLLRKKLSCRKIRDLIIIQLYLGKFTSKRATCSMDLVLKVLFRWKKLIIITIILL
jgi:hypothetical protein